MTRRASTIRRRTQADQALDIGVELAAAGMFWGWFRTDEWSARRFWAAIANVHGERIDAKLREAAPGCRAGYRYLMGEFPQVPFVEELPANHIGQRDYLTVEGERFWYVGHPFQKCQARHLRDLGVLDGAEWRRFLRWRDAGFPKRYVPDQSPDDRPMTLTHLCWSP